MDRSSSLQESLLELVKWLGKNAVVAGIVGGFFFAVISPFAMPWLTSWQAETGTLVDKPDVQVNVD